MSMSATTEIVSAPSTRYGKIRFIPAGRTPPPAARPLEMAALAEFSDERRLPLHDIRPLSTLDEVSTTQEASAPLFTRGFIAVEHPSIMHSPPYTEASWRDPEILQEAYIPEVQAILKQVTGARTVIVEAMVLRSITQKKQEQNAHQDTQHMRTDPTKKEMSRHIPPLVNGALQSSFPTLIGFSSSTGAMAPIPKPHMDYTADGARTRIRHAHPTLKAACVPIFAAEDQLAAAGLSLDAHYSSAPMAPRWGMYSVWRPLNIVKRDPLAVCDIRSVLKEDLATISLPVPDKDSAGKLIEMRKLERQLGRWGEGQRWHYVSEQKPEELLIIGQWDSDIEAYNTGVVGALHSSTELEGQEEGNPRQSLELRCVAIW